MSRFVLTLAFFGVLAPAVVMANPIPGANNTGANSQTCGASDSSWSVSTTSGPATVLNSTCTNWFGSWAADSTTSAWIGAGTTNPTPATPYTFTETFSLAGLNPSTANISGTWFIDDTGTLSINGIVIGSGSDTFVSGLPFTIPDADLNAGTNTISMTITSDNLADDGARLSFTSATASPSSVSTVPEPGTMTLLGLGGAALAALRRKRGAKLE